MKLLVVCGATATGKSAFAVELAKRLNGEIVSCDALLVYRGLNIGTAKPALEERGGIVHHLVDVVDPIQSFSVSDYEKFALAAVNDILARNKTPVLCGGTGFYMNSVLYSRSFGNASADDSVRKKYERIVEEEGKEALHAMLCERDPESAKILHPNDVKRVIRALEIYETTGKKKSEQNDGQNPRFDFECFAFDYPREELYRRIDLRVDEMLQRGLVGEVKGLLDLGVPENAQCMQGIGYKEVVEYLNNRISYSTMSDIIKKNTRNYAKRQLTFFKRTQRLHWLAPNNIEACVGEAIKIYDGR